MNYAIQQLSAEQWRTWTLTQPQVHLLQRASWGAFKSEFGWRAEYVAVTSGSQIIAGAQVLWRSKLGLKMAYVPRGPVWSADQQANELLIQAIERLARLGRAVFVRIEPNRLRAPEWDSMHSRLLVAGFNPTEPMQPAASIQLALADDEDTLLRNFSKGHRADVRRAERNGVDITEGTTQADLEIFYAIMQATAERAEFAIHSFAYYQRAWEIFSNQPDGAVKLWIARYEQEPVGAFMVFAAGAEAYYMYSGANDAGLKANASHALQWTAIRWAKAQGCTSYDFWGVPLPFVQLEQAQNEAEKTELEAQAKATGMYGVYRFKKGWGGAVVEYVPAYDRVFMKPIYWLWRRGA